MSKNTKIKGYKIDFTTNTLIMNYTFAAALNDISSGEYNLYKQIISDFPAMKTVVKSGRVQKSSRYNKRLTYSNMETYISTFDNSAELLGRFEIVKKKSAPLKSPYKYVSDWFVAQFPDYKDIPTFEKKNATMPVVAVPDVDLYKQKKDVA